MDEPSLAPRPRSRENLSLLLRGGGVDKARLLACGCAQCSRLLGDTAAVVGV